MPTEASTANATTNAHTVDGFGFMAANLDDVAQKAGVAKGTLYLYVESKEALFDACLRWARDPQPPHFMTLVATAVKP